MKKFAALLLLFFCQQSFAQDSVGHGTIIIHYSAQCQTLANALTKYYKEHETFYGYKNAVTITPPYSASFQLVTTFDDDLQFSKHEAVVLISDSLGFCGIDTVKVTDTNISAPPAQAESKPNSP